MTDGNTDIFIGKVWPNDAAFPDWSNTNTPTWWHSQLDGSLKFVDGLWLDMNEPSNFCNGYCYASQDPDHTPNNSRTMYTPGGRPLRDKTIPINLPTNDGKLVLDWH